MKACCLIFLKEHLFYYAKEKRIFAFTSRDYSELILVSDLEFMN